jgi:C-terminal processing protease CtpA/Prc
MDMRTVNITKGSAGYGFSLRGQHPVYMVAVASDGPAALAGVVPGDHILGINGLDVSDSSHDDVVALIKQGGATISLTLRPAQLPVRSRKNNKKKKKQKHKTPPAAPPPPPPPPKKNPPHTCKRVQIPSFCSHWPRRSRRW